MAITDELSISVTEQSVRPKLRDERAYSGVSDAVAEGETRAVTLTEPLRKSNGGRKDDSKSDSDDEARLAKCGDYDDTLTLTVTITITYIR